MNVLVVEDEIAIRQDLLVCLKTYPQINILGETDSIKEAQTMIETLKPDVVFLDIQLKDGVAFTMLNNLQEINFQIIFVTAYNNFALKAIKLGAIDYLLKPVDYIELDEAIKKAEKRFQATEQKQLDNTLESLEKPPTKIILKTSDGIFIVSFSDIIYCKAEGSYTQFHLRDEKKILVSKNLKEYEGLLPDYFFRCQKSYVVNCKMIIQLDKEDNLVLENDTKIPFSPRKKEVLLEKIHLLG